MTLLPFFTSYLASDLLSENLIIGLENILGIASDPGFSDSKKFT